MHRLKPFRTDRAAADSDAADGAAGGAAASAVEGSDGPSARGEELAQR